MTEHINTAIIPDCNKKIRAIDDMMYILSGKMESLDHRPPLLQAHEIF
jgi:hypothetical protein